MALACRHHVHEIILAHVFKHGVGASSGPEIGVFKRFREKWPLTATQQLKTAVQDPALQEILTVHSEWKLDALTFAKNALLTCSQTRDDYRELLELTIIFLGDNPPHCIQMMAPGAIHQARWMQKHCTL